MKPKSAALIATLLFCFAGLPLPAHCQTTAPSGKDDLQNQVLELKNKVADLELQVGQNGTGGDSSLQAAIAGLKVSGGISAGFFYTSNAGQDTSDSKFLLSNLLVEISPRDKTAPVDFAAAFGQTSTPSILGAPENSDSLNIEYASLTLTPLTGLGVEVGLLQPNAGYENSYTFNNASAFLGALASQQPYNAYGVRVGYDLSGLQLCAGYYKDRLDDDEYATGTSTAKQSWEIGLSGRLADTDFSVYHYHLANLRSLTGALVERTVGHIDVGLNLDYWRWEGSQKDTHASDAAIGAAFYVTPHFGRFSLPLRLEYIDQDKSAIYLDSANAKQIYAATLSPTYHFRDNIYVRADLAYVKADEGFADDDGNVENERICLAAEIDYLF
jgi:Putative beta-barrel porin-2, OmpL-like. bbp2